MILPRLLTAAQARRYLGNRDPGELGVTPAPLRGEVRYDRAVLDARLDQLSGLNRSSGRDDADADLQDWLESHGAA